MLLDRLRANPGVYRLAKRVQPAYLNLLRARATAVRAVTSHRGVTRLVQNPVKATTTSALCASPADAERAGLRAVTLHEDVRAHRTLPPGLDASQREIFAQNQHAASNAGVVYLLADGRSWGADGTIVTRDRQLVGNLSPVIRMSADAHPIFRRPLFQKPRRLDGRVAVATGPSPGNLSHWLFGVMPRLSLLDQWNPGFTEIDWLVVPQLRTPFQRECIERFGVPREKVIEADATTFVEAAELAAPSFVSPAYVAPMWFLDDLRRRFADVAPAAGSPRIYVSRRDAPGRKVTNERELTTLLESNGFRTVQFEHLPFLEQVALTKGASVIVSGHGAGLSHLAFAAPDAAVVELFAPNYINVMYWCLADELGLRYRCGIGRSPDASGSRDLVRQDITLDLDSFRTTLQPLFVH